MDKTTVVTPVKEKKKVTLSVNEESADVTIYGLLMWLKKDPLLYAVFEALGMSVTPLQEDTDDVAYLEYPNKIFMNFPMIGSLDPSLDFLRFVFTHEIMHGYFMHQISKKKNHRLDNIAKDYAINNYLFDLKREFNRFRFHKDVLSRDTLIAWEKLDPVKTATELNLNADSNFVYDYLLKNSKNKEASIKIRGFCSTDESGNNTSKEERDKTLMRLSEAIEASGASKESLEGLAGLESNMSGSGKNKGDKGGGGSSSDTSDGSSSIGSGSTGIVRPLIEKMFGRPSTEVLKILLRRCVANQRNKFTYKRASRRVDGDEIPGKVRLKQNKVCFIVDTSGSIDNESLSIIKDMIDNTTNQFSVTVRAVDCRLQNEIILNKGDKIDEKFFKGGGGTDMNPGFKDDDKFIHYLVFTDGYIPPIKTKKKRTLFLFTHYSTSVEGEICHNLRR